MTVEIDKNDPDAIDWKATLEAEDTLESAIGVAIGAASVCWSNPEGAGVFDSERASKIVDALVDLVRDYVR